MILETFSKWVNDSVHTNSDSEVDFELTPGQGGVQYHNTNTRKHANPAESKAVDVDALTTTVPSSKKLKHNKKDVNRRPQPLRRTGTNLFQFKENNH